MTSLLHQSWGHLFTDGLLISDNVAFILAVNFGTETAGHVGNYDKTGGKQLVLPVNYRNLNPIICLLFLYFWFNCYEKLLTWVGVYT